MDLSAFAWRVEGTALRVCNMAELTDKDDSPGKYKVLGDMTWVLLKRALRLHLVILWRRLRCWFQSIKDTSPAWSMVRCSMAEFVKRILDK